MMRLLKAKLKNGKADIAICVVLAGIFLTPVFVREIITSSTLNKINLVAMIGTLIILWKRCGSGTMKLRANKLFVFVGLALTFLLALSELHAGRSVQGFIRVFVGLILPLLILWYKPKNIQKTLGTVVKVFFIVSVISVAIGAVDLIAGTGIVAKYYEFAGDSNYNSMALKTTRLYSFWGHPLYNAQIFLSLIGLNYINSELFIKSHKKDIIVVTISLIGVAMSASKSAIVVCLLLLALLYMKNWKYMILIIAIVLVCSYFGVFDAVLVRFTGSLSTGRNEIWEKLDSSGIDFFHFFWGNGSDSKYKYESVINWARAAFEYPVRLYALEFGILFDIIIMAFLFAAPIIKLLKVKPLKFYFLIIFVGISAHVNVYNGIGTYSDQLFTFCLFGCMVLQAAEYYVHALQMETVMAVNKTVKPNNINFSPDFSGR